MIESGRVLQNRYRIENQIGQGGMGAVYIATDERFGSTVAIKETLFLDEKFRKAFEREARLLNSLRHPALPRVSDHFVDGNGQFLVMEYIDGDDLSEMMEHDRKAFALADVLNWSDQLLDALEYLHAQEMPVIHRDIKPQNLKLTKRGQIILLDFGLAKGNATNPESPTAAKSVFGYSRNYASLEQIQGTGTDPRSDLYSLAATMYHLVTGVPPADALTRAMNVLSEKEDPLVAVNEINTDVPESVAEVLHKSMALNASQRPVSAQAMRSMFWESEKTAADDLKTVADKRLETNIFTQKTEVLPAPADLTALKQSEIKTEVFAANAAAETAIKPPVTGDLDAEETRVRTQPKKSRRKFALVAAALGALVLACMAALGLYINKPELFGSQANDANNTNSEQKIDAVTVSDTNANVANVPTNNPDIPNVVSPSETKSDAKQNPVKQTETTKSETKSQTQTGQTGETTGTSVGEIPPPQVPKPDVPSNERRFPNGQPIPPSLWEKMTPQQRQKLKRAMEMQRQREIDERRRRQQQPPPR
jgi:serine/threonine protein kinase